MPSITSTQIIWDYNDWLSGLNKQYVAGLTDVPIPLAGNGLSSATKMNPFRFFGYAAPGFDSTDLTNVSLVSSVIRNVTLGAESSTNYGYLVGSDNKLYRLDISSKTLTNNASWPHSTSGVGTVTGSDIIAYTSNVSGTKTPCIFYSWNDSGGSWNIGRFRTDTGVFDDDFMSTVPATPLSPSGNNKPHAMIIGADDLLYVWDGNVLSAYDGSTGADGTFYQAVMTVPNGYIGTCFAPIDTGNPFLSCFAYYSPSGNSVTPDFTSSGYATAFFYDYLDLDPVRAVPLNDRIVTEAFAWKGTIGCFTEGNNLVNDGANRFTRLKIFDGSKFETVLTQIGNAPTHGGCDIVGDSIQWSADGTLFSYGSPFDGMESRFNRIGAGLGTSNGVLRTIGGVSGFQLISTGSTTSGGLQYMKASTFAGNASLTSTPALPVFDVGQTGKLRSVRVEFARSADSGRDFSLYMLAGDSDTCLIISALTTVDSTNLQKEYYFDTSGNPLFVFNELRCIAQWGGGIAETDAPILKRIVATYEKTNLVGTH